MGQGAERCRSEAEATLPYRYLSRTPSAQILNRRSGHSLTRWTRLRSGACGSRIRAQVTAPGCCCCRVVGDGHSTWAAKLEALSDPQQSQGTYRSRRAAERAGQRQEQRIRECRWHELVARTDHAPTPKRPNKHTHVWQRPPGLWLLLRILRARLYLVIGMVRRPQMTRFLLAAAIDE